jgi:hypothetical protein
MRWMTLTQHTANIDINRDPGYGSMTNNNAHAIIVILATTLKGRYDNVARNGERRISIVASYLVGLRRDECIVSYRRRKVKRDC